MSWVVVKIYGTYYLVEIGSDNMLNLEFDVMYKDKKVGRVEIRNSVVEVCEVYTDRLEEHPFPRSKTLEQITSALADRVIEPSRYDINMQREVGCKEYNVYKILRNTNGVTTDDCFWFRFKGDEDKEWEDVGVRGTNWGAYGRGRRVGKDGKVKRVQHRTR